jgi:hypothetical protein
VIDGCICSIQYYTFRAKKREKAKNLLFCHAPPPGVPNVAVVEKVLLYVETSNPGGARSVTGPVSEVPLIVKLRAPDGEPVPAVKFPILGTEVQMRGGMTILRANCFTVLLPTRFLATKSNPIRFLVPIDRE